MVNTENRLKVSSKNKKRPIRYDVSLVRRIASRSLIFSILALVFSPLAILGIIFAIISFVLNSKAKRKTNGSPFLNDIKKKITASKIISIIGLVLSILSIVSWVLVISGVAGQLFPTNNRQREEQVVEKDPSMYSNLPDDFVMANQNTSENDKGYATDQPLSPAAAVMTGKYVLQVDDPITTDEGIITQRLYTVGDVLDFLLYQEDTEYTFARGLVAYPEQIFDTIDTPKEEVFNINELLGRYTYFLEDDILTIDSDVREDIPDKNIYASFYNGTITIMEKTGEITYNENSNRTIIPVKTIAFFDFSLLE